MLHQTDAGRTIQLSPNDLGFFGGSTGASNIHARGRQIYGASGSRPEGSCLLSQLNMTSPNPEKPRHGRACQSPQLKSIIDTQTYTPNPEL